MASQGDPRVLLVLNLLLSAVFSAVVVSGLSFVGPVSFTWTNVAIGTAILMVLTWFVVLQ